MTRSRGIAILIGVAAVLAALGAGLWLGYLARPAKQEASMAPKPFVAAPRDVVPPTITPLSALPQTEQLKRASLAALGTAGTKAGRGENASSTRAVRLLRLPFGPVLLTETDSADDCHACTGFLGIYYLAEEGDAFRVLSASPEAVPGWGWGKPPAEWAVSSRFTSYPAIVAAGAYTGQGYTCESTTITELRPEGPVTSDAIPTASSNAGAIVEDGRTMGGEPLREWQGRIANIVPGRSFEVQVDGAEPFVERYAMKAGKFVRTSGDTRLGC